MAPGRNKLGKQNNHYSIGKELTDTFIRPPFKLLNWTIKSTWRAIKDLIGVDTKK